MGTQKNYLNETVLFSTKTYAKNYDLENIYNLMLKIFAYLNLCFLSKNVVFSSAVIVKMVVRVANRENPDQTASSEAAV